MMSTTPKRSVTQHTRADGSTQTANRLGGEFDTKHGAGQPGAAADPFTAPPLAEGLYLADSDPKNPELMQLTISGPGGVMHLSFDGDELSDRLDADEALEVATRDIAIANQSFERWSADIGNEDLDSLEKLGRYTEDRAKLAEFREVLGDNKAREILGGHTFYEPEAASPLEDPSAWDDSDEDDGDERPLGETDFPDEESDAAIAFANTHVAKMTAEVVGESEHGARMFRVRLYNADAASRSLDYTEALDGRRGPGPTQLDVLSSVQMNLFEGDFDEFCDEYGWSTDSIEGRQTFDAIADQQRKLDELYGPDAKWQLRGH